MSEKALMKLAAALERGSEHPLAEAIMARAEELGIVARTVQDFAAIPGGAVVAKEGADVILMKSDLMDVPRAIELSRAVIRNIKQDLFWALFYNALGIPLAAGVFYPLLGWQLSPMFGTAAMSLSSLCVAGNALRLRTFQPRRIDQPSQLGTGPA